MPVNEKIIAPRHIYAALRMIDFDDFIPILQRSEESKKRVFELFFDDCLF
jgi:hypothetical protein